MCIRDRIYTVTFNPALDYVVRMDRLVAGDTNRSEGEQIQLGGKGINVSTVLQRLGRENVALGFVAGFTGQALAQGLAREGLRTDFLTPVSYTHLDVYKRQIVFCVKWYLERFFEKGGWR